MRPDDRSAPFAQPELHPAPLPLVSSLTSQDLASDQEVRWCPGCGDFSILAQLKSLLASLGIPPFQLVFVSGIGCSSRLPYYLNTYGFHGNHGRAPAIATGLQLVRPDLSVWVVTGDGDGLSTGGNHLLHTLRRNVDLKILLFNNEVHGLTRGQYSPTSRPGTRTRTSPQGSRETPLNPLALALAAEATFVARTIDIDVVHLTETLRRAALHRGTAFVEIYQNCKIFNDGVFEYATDKGLKAETVLYLEDGQPLVFGADRSKGLRLGGLRGLRMEVVPLDSPARFGELLIHDERAEDPTLAYLLSRLRYPEFPECMGVFRCVDRPTFSDMMKQQIDEIVEQQGRGRLQDLLNGEENWIVR
jgi:2-oxoglutarate/2-oxoacid ferredoxin oxidoreductase subunit beta